jgi:hypothetical protein
VLAKQAITVKPTVIYCSTDYSVLTGTNHKLIWVVEGSQAPLNIVMYNKSGAVVKVLGSNVPTGPGGKGSLNWQAPVVTESTEYSIVVSNSAYPVLKQTREIKVNPLGIRVKNPPDIPLYYSETPKDIPVTINWDYDLPLDGLVKIEIFKSKFETVPLFTVTPGTSIGTNGKGTHPWSIPAPCCSKIAIKVSSLSDPRIFGYGELSRPRVRRPGFSNYDPIPTYCKY